MEDDMSEKPVKTKPAPKREKKTNSELMMKYLKMGMEEKAQKEIKKK